MAGEDDSGFICEITCPECGKVFVIEITDINFVMYEVEEEDES